MKLSEFTLCPKLPDFTLLINDFDGRVNPGKYGQRGKYGQMAVQEYRSVTKKCSISALKVSIRLFYTRIPLNHDPLH